MTTVAEILRDKGNSAIYSVSPRSTMLDALKMMAEKGVGALLVLDGAALAGIVTERDYARKIALQGRNSSSTLVGDVMTSKVHCVLPRQTSGECMALMTTHRIRHLPVMDENRQLVGCFPSVTWSRKSFPSSSSPSSSWSITSLAPLPSTTEAGQTSSNTRAGRANVRPCARARWFYTCAP